MHQHSLRLHLRTQTREAHERLDATVGALGTREHYLRFLLGMDAYRRPLEAALAEIAWPEAFGAWRPGAIAGLIVADLADLGIAAPPRAAIALAAETETLVGIGYVLEGSALGARVVLKQAQALGFTAHHGARHLAAQAADLANWRAFLALIEGLDLDRRAVAAAAESSLDRARAAMEQAR